MIWLRTPAPTTRCALSAQFAPALDGVKAHDEALEYAIEALVVGGYRWRCSSMSGAPRVYRACCFAACGCSTSICASAAASSTPAPRGWSVASPRCKSRRMPRRSAPKRSRGGPAAACRDARPAAGFLAGAQGGEPAARDFLPELGRAMAAGGAAPQRIMLAIDRLDALAPAEARRFSKPPCGSPAPAWRSSPPPISPASATRARSPRACSNSSTTSAALTRAGVAPALAAARAAAPLGDPGRSALAEPLDEAEIGFLKTASPLIGARPRALKRFYNAYRLARIGEAPRAAVALSLAALMAPDPDVASALRRTLASEATTAPDAPAELKAAFEALSVQGIGKDAARAAFAQARRFAPFAG